MPPQFVKDPPLGIEIGGVLGALPEGVGHQAIGLIQMRARFGPEVGKEVFEFGGVRIGGDGVPQDSLSRLYAFCGLK